MLVYVIVFSVVLLVSWIASLKKQPRKATIVLLMLAAIILSIFGGIRDYGIGTDIEVYGMRCFKLAEHSDSLLDYVHKSGEDIESGYLFVNYVVSRFTNNYSWLLFVLQLLTNIPIFIVIARHEEKCNPVFAVLIYLTLYYCQTFNMMRQALALSFYLLSLEFVPNRKWAFGLLAAISVSFHSSALWLIALRLSISLLAKRSEAVFRFISNFFIMVSMLFVVFATIAITYLHSFGILNEKYYSYIDRFSKDSGNIGLVELCVYALLVFLPLSAYVLKKKEADQARNVSLIIGTILYFSKRTIQYINRVAYYFQYEAITLVPELFRAWRANNKRIKIVYGTVITLALIMFWYITTCVWGWHEVYPYKTIWM